MKQIKKILLIILLFGIFIGKVNADAVSNVDYKIDSIYVNSSMDFIGSIHITEVIIVKGSINGFEREINYKNEKLKDWEPGKIDFENSSFYNGRGVTISKTFSFKLEEKDIGWNLINKKIDAYELNESAKKGDKGVYSEQKTNKGTKVKIYNPNESGYVAYVFDYYINQVAVLHNDVAEIYWTFLPQDFEDVKNVNIQLTLPGDCTDETFRFWAHGSLNGEIAGISETKDKNGKNLFRGVLATVKNVKSGSGVDIRLTFDKSLLPLAQSFLNNSEMNALEEIIKVETIRANLANNQRTIVKVIFYGSIGLSIIYLIGLLIIWLYIYKKYDKEYKIKFNAKYYREFTGNYEVETVEYLMKKNITTDAFSASIMNLIYKKNIEIEEIPNSKKDIKLILKNQDNLTEAEKLLVKLLFEIVGKNNEVTLKNLEKFSKKETTARSFVKGYDSWKEVVITESKKEEFFESKKAPKIIGISYFLLGALMCFILFFVNREAYLLMILIAILATIFLIYSCSFKKWSKKGREHYLKWNAFKNFLDDFGTFEDKEMPEIKLWEKYLVYATVLGIAKRVREVMKVRIENLGDEYISSYPTVTRNIYISDSINTAVTKSYSRSLTTINNAEVARSSTSSGGGFGGGFSSGGGFAGGGGSGHGF